MEMKPTPAVRFEWRSSYVPSLELSSYKLMTNQKGGWVHMKDKSSYDVKSVDTLAAHCECS